jgi:transcriptional regulator with XRE-family HTH domain
MQYTTLKGVPVFKPGYRRGELYNEARMRRIVRNSNLMRPHFRSVLKLKLTHDDTRQPALLEHAALGQTVRYYLHPGKGGPYVMADISGVPGQIAQVADKHFPNVSVEKYRLFAPGDGACVPDVIKSVALLGADAPEVKGLKQAYPEIFRDIEIFKDSYGDIERFEMEDRPMLGETIAAWRESLAMSPEDLAEIIGKSRDDIDAIETGAVEPDETTLQAIADALGVAVEDLQAGKMPEASEEGAGGSPVAAQFSEATVQRMIAEAVRQATGPLRRQVATLQRQSKKTEAELFAERQQRKQERITNMLERWQQPNEDGQAVPTVVINIVEQFMAGLDDNQVETFGEEQATRLDYFESMIDKFHELGLVDMQERAGGSWQRGAPQDADSMVKAYAKEHNMSYADAASELSLQGKIKP